MSKSNKRPIFVRSAKDGGWLLDIRVQPGARKNESSGLIQERLRIRLTAPPVDNKANKALLKYLAKELRLRNSQLELRAGSMSREKTIFIDAEQEPDWSVFTF